MVPESNLPPKKAIGGPAAHKNPQCPCNACVSRRRKEEAISQSGGAGGGALVPKKVGKVINADNPYITEGRSARDRVGQWILMRQEEPGISTSDVARRLGISPVHLTSVIQEAVKAGWLKFDDPFSRIENEIIPKVIDNISLFLDQKDKQVTIETAKGTIFKTFAESKSASETPHNIVAIKIETVDPASTRVITGQIVGKGREPDTIEPKD